MNKSFAHTKQLPIAGRLPCGLSDNAVHQSPLALVSNYDPTGDSVDRANWLAATHTEDVVRAFRVERIKQAARAQERDKEGLAGTCEDCGEAISHERRKVLPETTRCVRCQASSEQNRHRPQCGVVRARLHDSRVGG